ncbi:MAG: hypothetical protein U1F36_12635 [Planctomycetota bacterium]
MNAQQPSTRVRSVRVLALVTTLVVAGIWLTRSMIAPSDAGAAPSQPAKPGEQPALAPGSIDIHHPEADWLHDPTVSAVVAEFDGGKKPAAIADKGADDAREQDYSRWRDTTPERGGSRVFPILLAGATPSLGAIAHSTDLNPRSRRLTNSEIDALEVIVERYTKHLRWAASQSAEAQTLDIAEARSANLLKSAGDWKQDEGLQREIEKFVSDESALDSRRGELARQAASAPKRILERLGYILVSDPQVEFRYVPASTLRRFRDVMEYRAFRGEEYAFVLAAWFQLNGMLLPEEVQALQAFRDLFRDQSPILRSR